MRLIIRLFWALLFGAGIVYCIQLLSNSTLTPKESGLLSVFLTFVSVLATWVVAQTYSESQVEKQLKEVQDFHRTNLRTYALKAAEKVTNLSNELDRLSIYLQEELDETGYENVKDELLAKEERLQSAVHIVNTLRSVNDTALSDWQGVIGEELDQQREAQEQQEEALREQLDRIEDLSNQLAQLQAAQEDTTGLRSELHTLRRELRAVGGKRTAPRMAIRADRDQVIEKPCPHCNASIAYRQRPKRRQTVAVRCGSCGREFVSRYTQSTGFILHERKPIEPVRCPDCGTEVPAAVNPWPGAQARMECQKCQHEFTVVRTQIGLMVAGDGQAGPIDEKVIEAVRRALPPQPWPKGTARSIADSVGISSSLVGRVIQVLIKRGVVNPQIDGRVFVPVSDAKSGTEPAPKS